MPRHTTVSSLGKARLAFGTAPSGSAINALAHLYAAHFYAHDAHLYAAHFYAHDAHLYAIDAYLYR